MRVDPEQTLKCPQRSLGWSPGRPSVGQDGHVTTRTEPSERPPHPPVLRTPAPRPPLVRPTRGRVIGGVSAGLAAHLGVPVKVIRIAFIATSIPFGAGLAVYAFLWATMREGALAPAPSHGAPTPGGPTPPGATSGGATAASGSTASGRPSLKSLKSWLRSGNEAVVVTLLGVLALAIAAALWMSSAGIGIDPGVLLPVVAIVIGTIFFWSQLDEADPIGARRPVQWIWLVVGLSLTTLGLVGLLVGQTDVGEIWQVAGAVLAALVGVTVLAAPWILRLWSNLREEQAARIRATERADIAAHLHDSVLQTLALIQRRASDPAIVARLARAQERQLRSYLYDEDARAGTLGAALTSALDEIEDLHGVPVELVVTGDRPMDPDLEALVKAVREAAWNAVRHAEPPVTAYVEVGPSAVEAFVRDHGTGFDLDDVPHDRAGVRESIIGRMERHGGSAAIRRRVDGTEIELRLPVTESADAPSATGPGSSGTSSPGDDQSRTDAPQEEKA